MPRKSNQIWYVIVCKPLLDESQSQSYNDGWESLNDPRTITVVSCFDYKVLIMSHLMNGPMNDSLLRQRRLLIGISLAIIFLSAGEVKLEEISIAGNTVSVENPQGVYRLVWVIFAYLFLRYYQHVRQYKRQEGNLGIAEIFWGRMDSLSQDKLVECANRQIPGLVSTGPLKKFQDPMLAFSLLKKRIHFVWYGDVQNSSEGASTFEVKILHFTPQCFRALWYLLFSSSKLTDYYLPYVVAWVALGYGAHGSWEGSLVNVVRAMFETRSPYFP